MTLYMSHSQANFTPPTLVSAKDGENASNDGLQSGGDHAEAPSPLNENLLSEQQLRELYDNEEIERYLHLFSAYVTEVQVPDSPHEIETSQVQDEPGDDTEWMPLNNSDINAPTASHPRSQVHNGIAEEIAHRYVIPLLPSVRPIPAFSFSRLRVATERLYLATIPVYGPFLNRLCTLASWDNPTISFIYCFIFWTLWWYNLIMPAVIIRILYSLLKRRFLPYPSLEDLRRRREEVLRADEFGEQVSARLSSQSSNMKEIWRLFKIYNTANKSRLKRATASTPTEKEKEKEKDEPDQTVLGNDNDSKEVQDLKRIGLRILEEMADFHERVHNIFIWRRPTSSRLYGTILTAALIMSFLPAKYIAKTVYFALGFTYWHIVPVILALPSSQRKRLPPPFSNVPTDAEYAIEVISQRLAAGLDVNPARKQKKADDNDSEADPSSYKKAISSLNSSSSSIDWKKWGDRVALGKSAINDIRRLKPGEPWMAHEEWPPRHPLIAGMIGIAQPQATSETHTYPSQHGSTTGILTLTHSTLLFTPLLSQNPKLVIPLTDVNGIKKTGLLKGLSVRWKDSIDGLKGQKEERFSWVGNRDELFARLVGSDGKRWMKV